MEISAIAFPMLGYIGGTIEVRLDKPDGELLGQVKIESVNPVFGGSAANAAQNAGGAKSKTAKAAPPVAVKKQVKPSKKPAAGFSNPFARPGMKTDIKPVTGQHDIYLLFKNENAKGDEQLMSVTNIKFITEKTP